MATIDTFGPDEEDQKKARQERGKRFWFWRGVQKASGPVLVAGCLLFATGAGLGAFGAMGFVMPLGLAGAVAVFSSLQLASHAGKVTLFDKPAYLCADQVDQATQSAYIRKGMTMCLSVSFALASAAGGGFYLADKALAHAPAAAAAAPQMK